MATAEKIESQEASNVEALKKVGATSGSKIVKTFKGAASVARFSWHAWLGAALTVEEKASSMLTDFAKKGDEFEDKTFKKVSTKLKKTKGDVTEQIVEQTSGIRLIAQNKMSDVETIFDKGVNRSLHMLGVPTKHDVRELTSLMKDMSDAINDLSAQNGAAKAKRTGKTAEMN